MDSLPKEISLNILSRLPIASLICLKSVNHSWKSLAQDPLLASMLFSRMLETETIYPCLILHSDLPIQNHLYFLHFSDHSSTQKPTRIRMPFMSEFSVIGSCNGLLCLWDSLYKDECYIYNPFTRCCIKLPKPKQFPTQKRVAVGFGFHPKIKLYKVIRVVYYRKEGEQAEQNPRLRIPESEVQILTLGNGKLEWRSKGKSSYQLLEMSSQQSQVLVNGRLHWLTCKHRHGWLRKLISFDLEDEQFREVPNHNSESFGRHCSHLVALRRCLSAVYQGFQCVYIWVMKEYGLKESWIKEFSIGASLPRGLYHYPNMDDNNPVLNFSQARVLCLLRNGEILLQYYRKSMVSYDPKTGTFKEVSVQCLPECFNAVVHVASLNWIDTPLDL